MLNWSVHRAIVLKVIVLRDSDRRSQPAQVTRSHFSPPAGPNDVMWHKLGIFRRFSGW